MFLRLLALTIPACLFLAMLVHSIKDEQREARRVCLETTAGDIVIRLETDRAPLSVDNFLRYVRSGYYDGTIFHRVIDGFMIQGGGHWPDLTRRPEPFSPVVNESKHGLPNRAMSVAFAHGDDPDSAMAQFYINQVDNDYLNYQPEKQDGFTVFGQVVEGEDVVHAIAATQTHTVGNLADVPETAIVIRRARIE